MWKKKSIPSNVTTELLKLLHIILEWHKIRIKQSNARIWNPNITGCLKRLV